MNHKNLIRLEYLIVKESDTPLPRPIEQLYRNLCSKQRASCNFHVEQYTTGRDIVIEIGFMSRKQYCQRYSKQYFDDDPIG